MNRGKFIVFESVDHGGKTVQAELLKKTLKQICSDPFTLTKEPGCQEFDFTSRMRNYVVHRKLHNIDDETAIFLYLADRSFHMKNFVIPELEAGRDIICDRSYLTMLAYQCTDRFPEKLLRKLNNLISVKPDAVVYINIDPYEAERRGRLANKKEVNDNMGIERIIEIQKNYERILEHEKNVILINDYGGVSKEKISLEIFSSIRKLFLE